MGLPGSSDSRVVVGGLVGGGLGDGDEEDDDEHDEGGFQLTSKRLLFSFSTRFCLTAALTILHCKLYLQKHVLR